ncbi:hypothetical protein OIDMADRAFT_56458 [Oidiodendron maius Zn]|uniref:Uncharacterized protein n=1 Tax=Oidiodendron maius (strain Zn) TaxID=913774 RepID=A0A0C3CK31_OIDMZ|nr:hypothetical protein OIDMADRAFT_56458 [Oidiodendron maius Zn]
MALLLAFACSIERAAAAAMTSAPTNYNHANNNHDKRNQGNRNQDNCLRQALNTKSTASITTFYVTYTQTVNQAPAGVSAYVSQCSGSPSRISRMCSSVMSSSSLTSPTTLSAIVQLSFFSQGVSIPFSIERIRLNIGSLRRLGHVWATVSAVEQQISGIAQQLFTPVILEGRLTQDTSWP